MHTSTQQEVIERALDKLEESLFWDGFDLEAREYRKAYPGEDRERERFAGTSGDSG